MDEEQKPPEQEPTTKPPRSTVVVDTSTLMWVDILEAKPNPMFTEDQRATLRFLRYNQKVPCGECGRMRKSHWTMLCAFKAHTMAHFAPLKSGKIHPPLTPVCQDHLLALGFPDDEKTHVVPNPEDKG